MAIPSPDAPTYQWVFPTRPRAFGLIVTTIVAAVSLTSVAVVCALIWWFIAGVMPAQGIPLSATIAVIATAPVAAGLVAVARVLSPPAVGPDRMVRARLETLSVPSIIGPDLVVEGTLSTAGEIQIDGRVEGDVLAKTVIVSKGAVVRGGMHTQHITVRGTVEGSVSGKSAIFGPTCRISGRIMYDAFTVADGAILDCDCHHTGNLLAD